jgi:hypothetical protein
MTITLARANALRLPLPDQSVDLVIGSPPYLEARTYGIGANRDLESWVEFMLAATIEALRVSRGLVVWVCAGTGGTSYQPGPEGLAYRAKLAGLPLARPCYWQANKPPSGKLWFSNVVEYCLAFGRPLLFDVAPIATPLKFTSGGAFRQRGKDGTRKAGSAYPTHAVRKTAPNLFHVPVGGGLMGHPLATENEAPYPVGVPRRFILTCTPPGAMVLDPFGGGGTTAQACAETGRQCLSFDLRQSQALLARRRLLSVEGGAA